MICIPSMTWSQTNNTIILNMDILSAKDCKYSLTDNNLMFEGYSDDKKYEVNIGLYTDIINYKVEISRNVRIILEKREPDKWPRLTKDKNQYKTNIKVNWDAYDVSDDENEDEYKTINFKQPQSQQPEYPGMGDNTSFDMSQMMQAMGGMEGMQEMMKNLSQKDLDEMKKAIDVGGEKYFEDYDRMMEEEGFDNDDGNYSSDDNDDDDDDNNNDENYSSDDNEEYCQECTN